MPFSVVAELIQESEQICADELLVKRWLIGGYEQRCSFDDFKKILAGKPQDRRTADEISADIERKLQGVHFVKT